MRVGQMGHARTAGGRTQVIAATVVALTVVAAMVGATLTILNPRISSPASASSSADHRVGDVVDTSFGSVTVQQLRQVDGVTHRALNGSTHGVKDLVDAGHAKIQVDLTLVNGSEHPFRYSADQFRLRIQRNGRSMFEKATGGDLPGTTVLPGSGVGGHLDFTIPRVSADLAVVFRDPARRGPISIQLGRAHFDARAPGNHEH